MSDYADFYIDGPGVDKQDPNGPRRAMKRRKTSAAKRRNKSATKPAPAGKEAP